ncbi:PHP domain-containing protein [Halonatronum saccharophilum]|uniref:PHP domain-containing protein n=1 Tax=Halonatronum saccharophilum TaxID=150060 RepID=UPI0004819B8D|nr:PHP domain-containing protein [Halonatronum saccharophilum]
MLKRYSLSTFFDDFLTQDSFDYVDLHIHTRASDGLITTKFLKNFLKDRNHLISITDHNEITSCLELHTIEELNIVPGIEVGCSDGFELLVYFKDIVELKDFYNNHVKPFKNRYKITRTNKGYQYYLKEAQNYDSFISIPHISGIAQKNYIKNKDYIEDIIPKVDGIESYNHSLPKRRNSIASKIMTKSKKSPTFGSDAHITKEMISFYNLQNNDFSKSFYLRKNIYHLCSIIVLFAKHLYYFMGVK